LHCCWDVPVAAAAVPAAPTPHAWVSAARRQRLDKAVSLLLDVMQPTNATAVILACRAAFASAPLTS
jgi:hypothetical protein